MTKFARSMAWAAFVVIACLLLVAGAFYYYFEGKLDVLVRDTHSKIEVNGVPVKGDVLTGRYSSLVTIREQGRVHSYFLYWIPVDDLSPMPVMDCRKWVAPDLPVYLAFRGYSDHCDDDPQWLYYKLHYNPALGRFVTLNGDVVSLELR